MHFLPRLRWTLILSGPPRWTSFFLTSIFSNVVRKVKFRQHLARFIFLDATHRTSSRSFCKALSSILARMFLRMWLWNLRSLTWQPRSTLILQRLQARLCWRKIFLSHYCHVNLILNRNQIKGPEISVHKINGPYVLFLPQYFRGLCAQPRERKILCHSHHHGEFFWNV